MMGSLLPRTVLQAVRWVSRFSRAPSLSLLWHVPLFLLLLLYFCRGCRAGPLPNGSLVSSLREDGLSETVFCTTLLYAHCVVVLCAFRFGSES